MKHKMKLRILGMSLFIIAMVMAVIFYDWKLAVIIFMAISGNNTERTANKQDH